MDECPDGKPDEITTSQSGGHSSRLLLVGCILVVTYLLAAGPAWCYRPKNPHIRSAVSTLYYPLGWLRGHSRTVKSATDWYFEHIWHYQECYLANPDR